MPETRPDVLSFPQKKVIIAEEVLPPVENEQSFLKRSAIKTFGAATNDEALSLHRAERSDLIIAMLEGRGMSGEELCSAIREDDELCQVSIIVICADTEADRERCLGCRANAFVKLPVNTAVLLQESHHLLNIAPRRAVRTPIDVDLDVRSGRMSSLGSSVDISETGMLFSAPAEIPEGDTVTCSFDLPGVGHVSVDAFIVRASGGEGNLKHYGVSFIEPEKDVAHAIKLFVRKQALD